MTNEEKILKQLDELSAEIKEVKETIKRNGQSESKDMLLSSFENASKKLVGLDEQSKQKDMDELARMFILSSQHISTALGSLNNVMEFATNFEPISKDIFKETVNFLDKSGKGFKSGDLQELMKQVTLNMDNIAESMKILASAMDFKHDAGKLTKLAFDDIVERLELLKRKGVFDALTAVLGVVERMGEKLAEIDFNRVEPIKGIFGMLRALKRPDVQEGLGIMIELSSLSLAIKKPVT